MHASSRGAGTNATVSIQLVGSKTISPIQVLHPGRSELEKGSTDAFLLTLHDVGLVDCLKVWHNGRAGKDAWHLYMAVVKNLATG